MATIYNPGGCVCVVSRLCGGTPATEAPAQPEAPAVSPTEAPPAAEEPVPDEMCMGANPGDEVSMLYQWSGQEEERLN
ncbi:MAG TPA: hypothetical protein PLF42_03420 [Anaerolineales bacterium]|nr:hypothetical protein [Anaerolineales bacterium]